MTFHDLAQDLSASAPHTLKGVQTLVGLSSLRNLSFLGNHWQVEQLYHLFAHCTPGLVGINFYACNPAFTPVPTQPTAQRPQIRSLGFHHALGIPDILVDPLCPLDLSTITEVHCARSMGPALEILLFQARLTIKSLHFGGNELLNLSIFPTLKYIKCDDMGPTFICLVAGLRVTNVVDRIHLVLFGGDIRLNLREFKASVLTIKMPQLPRVEVEVVTSVGAQGTGASEDSMSETLRVDLPTLHKRGLLCVHFN
ncbi:hypothetical protein B0H17DRAFT_1132683 [Mycena rosella]|uniref:Uncharacterized protein n=1 Tax=Mycena rosella TaxID=1033263 RepID=A0AAD7DJI5_MYCRO|nr:hypothetical protein B0H17DRAFT_1132683 [Mycena rosella]